MSDQSIITLLRSEKSGSVFLKLYDFYPKVEKMIYQHGGTRDDAKDVYQEALMVLHRKAKDEAFSLSAAAETYLYSVSRFLWMDELRKRGKLPTVRKDEELDQACEQEVGEYLIKEEKFKLAEKAIALLGEKCRQVLQLFYVEEKSMQEIAALLGYNSENTAKTQKYKCLESAKQNLSKLLK